MVRDPYARWCERGAPRGVPLLDFLGAGSKVVDGAPSRTMTRRGQRVAPIEFVYCPAHPKLGFPHFTQSDSPSLRMVLPVRQGLRRRRSVAGTSKSPPLPMRGLAACGTGSALTVGRADVRAPADRCWRDLVTHAVLTVRWANVRKIIAEKMRRAAESRGGHVPPRLRRRHAASAALSGPPHLLRDELLRTAGQPVPPRWLGTPAVSHCPAELRKAELRRLTWRPSTATRSAFRLL